LLGSLPSTINFADRLLPGEKLIWSDRPAQGLLVTGRDWFLIPFSLIWGGFAIFWELGVAKATKAPAFFPLFGIPFVLVGLYLIFGRFIVDAWARQNMEYAVTSKRILISRSAPFGKFIALNLHQLPAINLTETRDGRGTIRFGEAGSIFNNRNGWSSWTPAFDPTPQFLGIENARDVFEQIQGLQNSA
jgi:hypothetical protein